MTLPKPLRYLALVAALAACFSAQALTLGAVRGTALVGKPLELTVPLDITGADPSALCLVAEPYYGDARVDASRVTVKLEGSGANALVRITASQPVNEPVVNLQFSVGCVQPISRRYVVFAEYLPELPSWQESAALPLNVASSAANPITQAPQTATPLPPSAASRGAASRATRRAAMSRLSAAAPSREAAGATRTSPSARSTVASRPHLKLEPLGPAGERSPVLRGSFELSSTVDESKRAQAAAQWRALTASPEEVLRETQRTQALEADVQGLRTAAQNSSATVAEMTQQVARTKAERGMLWIAVVVMGVLVVLAAAAWLWSRRQQQSRDAQQWWRSAEEPTDEEATETPPPVASPAAGSRPPGVRSVVLPTAAAGAKKSKAAFEAVDVSNPQPSTAEEAQQSSAATAPITGGGAEFQSSFPANRAVKAEELIDIQQQSDFFASLGQYDHAIEVLESHIESTPETSALTWLDLLEIYHRLGRAEDYERRRTEFQRRFNAEVPTFEGYKQHRDGLEAYDRALSRIVALWPSRRVLEVIEESIFRKPGAPGAEPFSLEAYRELVLLYNIAREYAEQDSDEDTSVPETWEAEDSPADFSHTSLEPLSTISDQSMNMPSSELADLGVDIDLGSLPPIDESRMGKAPENKGGDKNPSPSLRHDNTMALDLDLMIEADNKKQDKKS